mmetsp:Transcript_6905/g.12219  ORF Transcript_6905/g.12219 Transcript_6905/m.12219 type:complete len:104 (+) Transcript_6905:699-1010(+)
MPLQGFANPTSHTPRHPSLLADRIDVELMLSEVIEPAWAPKQCVHLSTRAPISHTFRHHSLPEASRLKFQAMHTDVTGASCAWHASTHPLSEARSKSLREPIS